MSTYTGLLLNGAINIIKKNKDYLHNDIKNNIKESEKDIKEFEEIIYSMAHIIAKNISDEHLNALINNINPDRIIHVILKDMENKQNRKTLKVAESDQYLINIDTFTELVKMLTTYSKKRK